MYLTGYIGPKTDELEQMTPGVRGLSKESAKVMDPNGKVNMHESVLNKINAHRAAKGDRILFQEQSLPTVSTRNPNCKWYDISCLLRWLYISAGVQFGAIVGTMEPMYDADSFPNGEYF
jgi:hypothetical protein